MQGFSVSSGHECASLKIVVSAVRVRSRGDCWDNAVAESFFATLKKELMHRQSWPARRELSSAVFEYIEAFYNRDRRHSTLGMHSPTEYEQLIYPANTKQSPTTKNIKSKSGSGHAAFGAR